MTLSVIIVNYNTKELLKKCVESVISTFSEAEIIVVDNASSDKSRELIKTLDVKYVLLEQNLGFSKANNIGLKEATGDAVLFLNPDTIVKENTLKRCLEFLQSHPDAGAVGCRVVLPDGKMDKACKRKFPTPFNSFCTLFKIAKIFPRLGYNLSYLDDDGVYEVDCLVGAFMMCSVSAIKKTGGFDENFFMYGEDIDLCLRIKKAGFKIWYLGDHEIIHVKGAAGKRSKKAKEAFYDSMSIYYKKHFKKGLFTAFVDMGVKFLKRV
ncbi:MAG: glycosyltransferase family 2 protein [Clostridia bacterium]|nr:glycosyltransferase family 2 protein [Clostridia bacterium]